MPVIEVEDLTRTYGKGRAAFTAVNGVSFSVEPGELVAILGVNGAGKTSLVEVVEGLAPATSGRVRVLGADPLAERQRVRPHMGIMLQEAGFAGALTVRETLRMWAGTLTAPRTIDEALTLTDLTHRENVRVKALSGGERRRLDLALATLGRPSLLFLDEPTTGLDPASRRRTWELVTSMLDEGTSVVLTTHYLEEAEELADRILIMANGKIARQGTLSEIVAAQPSLIMFHVPDEGALPRLLRDLETVLPHLVAPIHADRGKVTMSTSHLQETLTVLLTYAQRNNLDLANMDARSASLEQAFLALSDEN
ncbi:ABC transporter ATP-binding protein [Arcanobacterium haemolyticum]|nr:ABC transporter ATP-binding protein [Arcanobacterium haemolyticum]